MPLPGRGRLKSTNMDDVDANAVQALERLRTVAAEQGFDVTGIANIDQLGSIPGQRLDAFLAAQKPDTPIILAGHSQGSMHLLHLLQDRVAGKPVARRIIAVYAIGWPISVKADLPALGLPACATPDQTGCVMSWQSYAEPAEYKDVAAATDAQPGLTGTPRGDAYLCTNPLAGGATAAAAIKTNLGTLKSSADLASGEIIPGAAPARCDAKGYLLIGAGPDLGSYVLPGNNYHVYDYNLFWVNIRADVARRTKVFAAK